MAAKLLVAKLPPTPAARWSALVLQLGKAHVTRTSLPSCATEVMWNKEAPLVGSMPVRYSLRLGIPSPSGSALGLVTPYRVSQSSPMPLLFASSNEMDTGMLVTLFE